MTGPGAGTAGSVAGGRAADPGAARARSSDGLVRPLNWAFVLERATGIEPA